MSPQRPGRAIGIDGCPVGWVAATADAVAVFEDINALLTGLAVDPACDTLAIDMPIGLVDTGHRRCDQLARELLGHRRNSVFWTATRDAVHAADSQDAATRINRANGAGGVSAQAYNLFPKIREIEAALLADPALAGCVYEVHPELAFACWQTESSDGPPQPMAHPKKSGLGAHDRLTLIFARYERHAFDAARAQNRATDVADDDIADAYAALHAAERIAQGRHVTLPKNPPIDARSLPIRICY